MTDNIFKQPIDIKDSVIKKVSSGDVKMRSHWTFVAQELGLDSGILLALVLAIFFFSLVMHYWDINELHRYFGFGSAGIWFVIMNFPYEYVGLFVLFLVAVNYFIKKMDWGYKRSWIVWVGASFSIIFLLSALAFAYDFHEKFETRTKNVPVISGVYQQRVRNVVNKNILGEIKNIKGDEAEVDASDTNPIFLDLRQVKTEPLHAVPHAGERVKLLGQWNNDHYQAWEMDIVSQVKKPVKWYKFRK